MTTIVSFTGLRSGMTAPCRCHAECVVKGFRVRNIQLCRGCGREKQRYRFGRVIAELLMQIDQYKTTRQAPVMDLLFSGNETEKGHKTARKGADD